MANPESHPDYQQTLMDGVEVDLEIVDQEQGDRFTVTIQNIREADDGVGLVGRVSVLDEYAVFGEEDHTVPLPAVLELNVGDEVLGDDPEQDCPIISPRLLAALGGVTAVFVTAAAVYTHRHK